MNDASLHSSLRAANRSRWLHATPLALVVALGMTGCEVHAGDYDDYDYEYVGSLSIDWSLDDTDDPRACEDYDAWDLELIIYEGGSVTSRLEAPCDDFGVSIDLPDGVYSLDATLIDRDGRDVSTTLKLDEIDVYAGEDTPISIDFPQDSRR